MTNEITSILAPTDNVDPRVLIYRLRFAALAIVESCDAHLYDNPDPGQDLQKARATLLALLATPETDAALADQHTAVAESDVTVNSLNMVNNLRLRSKLATISDRIAEAVRTHGELWAVFNKTGLVLANTISASSDFAVKAVYGHWNTLTKHGYTVRRVAVVPLEDDKPTETPSASYTYAAADATHDLSSVSRPQAVGYHDVSDLYEEAEPADASAPSADHARLVDAARRMLAFNGTSGWDAMKYSAAREEVARLVFSDEKAECRKIWEAAL